MKINLIEMEGLLRGQCIPGDLFVNETLAEYLVRQFDKLEQQLAAVVAENGQMLRLLTDISENHDEYVNADEYLYAGVPMDYVSEINAYVSRDVDAENPFKATDAYLAEVRAQGVEMFAASERKLAAKHASIIDTSNVEYGAARADDFAAQLRQGAEHE